MTVAKPKKEDCIFREWMMLADEGGNAPQFSNTHHVCVTKTMLWLRADAYVLLSDIRRITLYEIGGLPKRFGIEITFFVAENGSFARLRLCFHILDIHLKDKPRRLLHVLEQACAKPTVHMGRLVSENRQRHLIDRSSLSTRDGLLGSKELVGLKIINHINCDIDYRAEDRDDFEQALERLYFLLQTHRGVVSVPSREELREIIFRHVLLVRCQVYGPLLIRFGLPLILTVAVAGLLYRDGFLAERWDLLGVSAGLGYMLCSPFVSAFRHYGLPLIHRLLRIQVLHVEHAGESGNASASDSNKKAP